MDQNAPNQVIGTGSLQVKPEMDAVHAEMDRIDKRIDEISEKFKQAFKADTDVQEMASKFEKVAADFSSQISTALSAAMDEFEQRMAKATEGMAGREDNRPIASNGQPIDLDPRQALVQAVGEQAFVDLARNAEEINSKLDQIIVQTAT